MRNICDIFAASFGCIHLFFFRVAAQRCRTRIVAIGMTILVPIVPMATIQRKKPVSVPVLHSLLRMGERVKIARKARQMTQAELAQLAGVGISTVASIEGATMASHLVMCSGCSMP